MFSLVRCRVYAALAILLIALATPANAEPLRFVAIGDIPYGADQSRVLETEIRPAIAAGHYPFVIHVGDFKSGGASCSDRGLEVAYEQIMSLLPDRVFYTPGDNDWTDCDRGKLTKPIPELARLAKLREIFYTKPMDLPADWAFRSQAEYPENAQWRYGDIQFATVHVVGTNNGRKEIELDDERVALDAVDARDAANNAWLKTTFADAADPSVQALVVATQADISRVGWNRDCSRKRRTKCDGFSSIRKALVAGAASLGKPVLIVHGDTGRFCVDREFGGDDAPNLWRLNGAGDWVVDAAIVEINVSNSRRPFTVFRILDGSQLYAEC